MNDLNPALSLGDEGIDMILHSLHSIRERALSECMAPAQPAVNLH